VFTKKILLIPSNGFTFQFKKNFNTNFNAVERVKSCFQNFATDAAKKNTTGF